MILMRFLISAYIGIFTTILANEQGPDFNQLYTEEGDLLDAVNVRVISAIFFPHGYYALLST